MTGKLPLSDDLQSAAAHGVRWSAIARPTIEIVQLGAVVVLARLIAPVEFGRFAIALIVQEVAFIVAGGLSAALIQRKAIDRTHEQAGMALGILSGLALGALTLIAASLVVAPIFGTRTALFVQLMAPLCLISALSTVPMATLRRRMAFRRLTEIEVISVLARVAVGIGLALSGLKGEALVFGMVAGALTMTAMACSSAPPPLPCLRRSAARELLDYGLPVSLASISWIGLRNADYAIIGARLGALQTGLYFRAYTLAVEYENKISVVMTQVGFPVLARTRSGPELAHLYGKMVRLLTLVLFPLLVLVAIGAPVLVPFLFGPQWTGAVVATQILALGGAATLVSDAAGTVLMATGRAHALLGYGLGHMVVYGASIFLVAPLGIVAVAIDAAVVHAVFLVVAYVLMHGSSPGRPLRRLWADIAPAVVSCLGLVSVSLPASFALTAAEIPAVLWLAALGLIATPSYLMTLYVCFPKTWRSQGRALKRIIPWRTRLPSVIQRLRPAGARSSA